MAILAFLIRWRRVALPLALLVALGISMGVSYYKGYRACTVKFKAQAQERVIEDVKKQAQSWADRPVTVDAAIDRVRRAADSRR